MYASRRDPPRDPWASAAFERGRERFVDRA